MSIQQNTTQWGAELPPSPTDALYWRERLRTEVVKFRAWPRPSNPELQANVWQYWKDLWKEKKNDNDSQSA